MSKQREKEQTENPQEKDSIISRENNYRMIVFSEISFNQATLLYFIRTIQMLSLVALPLDASDDIPEVINFKKFYSYIDFRFLQQNENSTLISLCITSFMLLLQILVCILMSIKIENQTVKCQLSKIITCISLLTPIYISSLISKNLIRFLNFYQIPQNSDPNSKTLIIAVFSISLFLLFLMILTQYMFISFHFQCTFKVKNKNKLSRFPKTATREYLWILLALFSAIFKQYAYPELFIFYQILVMMMSVYEAKQYCLGIQYINSEMNRNIGILSILAASFCIGNIFCLLNVTLFKKSVIVFIVFFFLFAANFYMTYRSYHFKEIIIDDNTPTESAQITYVLTYILISQANAEKKNETYLSSALRNHLNNCLNSDCFCKNRNNNYDPLLRKFDNIQTQPHLDPVFIKHFLLQLIAKSIEEFPKSLLIKVMHCIYYLEFIENKVECSKYIQLFERKSMKTKASVALKYVIFCIEKQFLDLLHRSNKTKGNQLIQKVIEFDDLYIKLTELITEASYRLFLFWQKIQKNAVNNHKMSPFFLEAISEETLNGMNEIEGVYIQMKKINSASNKLRQIMFFYSKDIANDMFLFEEIRQATQEECMTNKLQRNKNDEIKVNIYSQNTASLVAYDINSIKWSSNNASTIFGYKNRYEFTKMKINNLMPLFFAKNHDRKVKNWLRTGKCNKMNKNTFLWASMENGTCFKSIIYLKVMPNLLQKDIEYFISLQFVSKNEIICTDTGEIIGCDEMFANFLGIQLKFMQSLRPCIHLIFPQAIQHFSIFTGKKKFVHNKRKQAKYSGYIPNRLFQFLEQFSHERQKIYDKRGITKNGENVTSEILKENEDLLDDLSLFFEEQIQEINVDMHGRYITIDFQVEEVSFLSYQLFVFRINKNEGNTIENYYEQLEKALKLIKQGIQIRKEEQSEEQIISQVSVKKKKANLFNLFLNPKKCKKMLENNEVIPRQQSLTRMMTITQRKKRAKHRLQMIKNQRVRENLIRIKRALYREGIFSYYTYSMLMYGEQNGQRKGNMTIIEQASDNTSYSDDFHNKKSYIGYQDYKEEEDENSALLNESKIKEDENVDRKKTQIFNERGGKAISFQESQASSAALISLTTKIKNIKHQLKAKYIPNKLIALNLTFWIFMVILTGLNAYTFVQEQNNSLKKAAIFDFVEAETFIMISLMSGRIVQSQIAVNDYPRVGQIRELQFTFTTIARQTLYYYYQEMITIQNFVGDQFIRISDMELSLYEGYNVKQFFLQEIYEIYQDIDHFHATFYNESYHKIFEKSQNQVQLVDQIKQIYKISACGIIFSLMIWSMMIEYQANKKLEKVAAVLQKIYPHERKHYLSHFLKVCMMTGNYQKNSQRYDEKYLSKSVKYLTTQHSKDIELLEKTVCLTQKIQNIETYNNVIAEIGQKIKKVNQKKGKQIYIKIILLFSLFIGMVIGMFFLEESIHAQIQEIQDLYQEVEKEQIQLSLQYMILQEYAYDQRGHHHLPQEEIQLLEKRLDYFQVNSVKYLIDLLKHPFALPELMAFIDQFSTTNRCGEVKGIALETCQSVGLGTFKNGGISSYFILKQGIDYYYNKIKNNQSLSTSTDPLIQKFNSTELAYISAINGQIGISLIHHLGEKVFKYKSLKQILGAGILGAITIFCGLIALGWRKVYLSISDKESGYNSYLLMIPFDVLLQNPYIKLYLKKNVNTKSNAA